MATVTMPDGRSFEIPDGQPQLEAYYLGEGATVEKSVGQAAAELPRVFNGGGYVAEPAPVEQLPAGEVAEPSGPAVAAQPAEAEAEDEPGAQSDAEQH